MASLTLLVGRRPLDWGAAPADASPLCVGAASVLGEANDNSTWLPVPAWSPSQSRRV